VEQNSTHGSCRNDRNNVALSVFFLYSFLFREVVEHDSLDLHHPSPMLQNEPPPPLNVKGE